MEPGLGEGHGIRGSDLLARGQPSRQIAAALNTALGPGTAWCDGSPYDAHWARALFKAGGVKPTFALGDWPRLAAMLGAVPYGRALDWLERTPTRHRACEDAEQLLLALARAVEVGPVQDLAQRLPALAALTAPFEGAPRREGAA